MYRIYTGRYAGTKKINKKDEQNPYPAFGEVGALRAPTVDFVYLFVYFLCSCIFSCTYSVYDFNMTCIGYSMIFYDLHMISNCRLCAII